VNKKLDGKGCTFDVECESGVCLGDKCMTITDDKLSGIMAKSGVLYYDGEATKECLKQSIDEKEMKLGQNDAQFANEIRKECMTSGPNYVPGTFSVDAILYDLCLENNRYKYEGSDFFY